MFVHSLFATWPGDCRTLAGFRVASGWLPLRFFCSCDTWCNQGSTNSAFTRDWQSLRCRFLYAPFTYCFFQLWREDILHSVWVHHNSCSYFILLTHGSINISIFWYYNSISSEDSFFTHRSSWELLQVIFSTSNLTVCSHLANFLQGIVLPLFSEMSVFYKIIVLKFRIRNPD